MNKIKDILSLLESRLCQLGSSWSWGTCPSEMARWTVLWCQIPRIQHFLHVPGIRVKHMTYFFAVWPSYSVAVKSGAVLHMFKSLKVVRSPELYAERLRVWKKVKGHLRQRLRKVMKVKEEMDGGRKKLLRRKGDVKAHAWREREKEYEKEVTICIIQTHWNIQLSCAVST